MKLLLLARKMAHMTVPAYKHSLVHLAYKTVYTQVEVCILAQLVYMMTQAAYNQGQVCISAPMAYKMILVDYRKIQLVYIQLLALKVLRRSASSPVRRS